VAWILLILATVACGAMAVLNMVFVLTQSTGWTATPFEDGLHVVGGLLLSLIFLAGAYLAWRLAGKGQPVMAFVAVLIPFALVPFWFIASLFV
jgi:hypothetical protein